MGMAYSDHDYGGYSKNASPSPPPVELVDCGQCFQCLSAKSHALELDLDTLASKPVVVLKVSCFSFFALFCTSLLVVKINNDLTLSIQCVISLIQESCCQSKRISMGGKNGPTVAMFTSSNPEPESPKAGTKADTLGLELSIPSLYSASDLMMIEHASGQDHLTDACDLSIGKNIKIEPTLTSGLLRRSPSPLSLSTTIGRRSSGSRKKKYVTKPIKKVLLSNYRSYNSRTRDENVTSDDELYLAAAERDARESLFFDEILNANSPFL